MIDNIVMLNEATKRQWMAERLANGYSFVYRKGTVIGATYSDGTPEKERNVAVECVETGETLPFLWS